MPVGREKAVFLSALDYETGSERESYLEAACGNDLALRLAVVELLATHDRPNNVLDGARATGLRLQRQLQQAAEVLHLDGTSPGVSNQSPSTDEGEDRAGELIGNYRLMEKIGEGGFGEVYVAEQQQPVRRRVALKLLKPGMESREVIARFEAERQALALMDHPNIARVYDAGATAARQPYFVMELVRGVPITDFCRERKLSLRERLKLFVDVCRAVQHAHQKGVIHRDLKPSNVLVTLHDAAPVAKVIDFGVAKAVGQSLTEKTIYTRFSAMIGTPLYMSPEQAEMSGLDVDTRSDIYSLGVILYELLTGSTPFERERLQSAGLDELRRIIREEEPPRPSERVSTLARAFTTEAAPRRADSHSLAMTLRGELDWIVMKAVEKDRRRRYDTAADLAQDVERYLNDRPVAARPPSNWYRFQKFVRRNRVAFSTAAFVLLALVAGTAVSTWQAVRATQARAEADSLRRDAVEFADRLKEANVLLDSARANADEERFKLAMSQYTKATMLQPDHYLAWSGRGSLFARQGAWRAAAADYAKALKLGAPANNPGWWGVPQICLYAGDENAYRVACEALRQQLKRTEDPVFVMMAARSLLMKPINPDEARALADRLDKPSMEGPWNGFGRGGPGKGPPFGEIAGSSWMPHMKRDSADDFQHMRGAPFEANLYFAGLAHFRAGNLDHAIDLLRGLEQSRSGVPGAGVALNALALAYHAAGQTDSAEHALKQAEVEITDSVGRIEKGGPMELPFWSFDFLESWILYREAHQQVRGSPPPNDGRLDRIEQRALAVLGL